MVSKKTGNKGYSLVEMIIVLAIIGIVSGISIASVTMIHSAKAKDASVVFDAEISELIAKSKSMNNSDGLYAIRLYREGSTFYIQSGTAKKSSDNKTWLFTVSPNNKNGQKGTNVSKYVKIAYVPEGTAYSDTWLDSYDDFWNTPQTDMGGTPKLKLDGGSAITGTLILYTKSGDCLSGNGTFGFYKRNGHMVARVIVRKNGSHEAR